MAVGTTSSLLSGPARSQGGGNALSILGQRQNAGQALQSILTGAQVQYIAPQVFDSVEQARLIEAAVATKPDGIVVSIPDIDALKGAIQSALAAGIPVINVDSGEKQGESIGVPLYVGTTSEYQAGIRAGERLAKDGILKVACINHEVGNISLDERCQGINDGLAKSGGASEVVAVSQDPDRKSNV